MNTEHTSPIEFIGVYDADSTLLGEISYWVNARLGRTHCSLCELTHGMFTKKTEWKSCESRLPIPFLTFHRNDAPPDVLQAAQGKFPLVLARYSHGLECVMSQNDLQKFKGDTSQFNIELSKFLKN